MRSAILSLLRLLDAAESAAAPRAATGGAPAVTRAAAPTTSQDFERIGSITIEELARSQAELETQTFLLDRLVGISGEQLRLMGGTPPPFALGSLVPAPQPPVFVTGGGGFSINQVGPIGPFFVPEGSDPGGIDYDAFSEIMMSRIREALRASGQLGF